MYVNYVLLETTCEAYNNDFVWLTKEKARFTYYTSAKTILYATNL